MPVLKQISPPVVPFFPIDFPSIRKPSARRRHALLMQRDWFDKNTFSSRVGLKKSKVKLYNRWRTIKKGLNFHSIPNSIPSHPSSTSYPLFWKVFSQPF